MTVTERKQFKKSHSLLKKPTKNLTEDEKFVVAILFKTSDAIRTAYILKEGFTVLSHQKISAMTALTQWMEDAEKTIKENGDTAYKLIETVSMR